MALALALTSFPAPQAWAAPAVSASEAKPLDLTALSVPEQLGRVVETWQPEDRKPSTVIIHLQDLHTHAEAQQHLSGLIGHFRDRFGVELVALEGAAGLCDTTLYSDFPDPPSTEKISRLFMQEGLFTGAEYYGITNPGKVALWGVEDEATYLEHLKVYGQGAEGQAQADALLAPLREQLRALRAQIYPGSLHNLLLLRDAYEGGENQSFQPYLTELVRLSTEGGETSIDLSGYPSLLAMVQTYELHPQLNTKLVEADRDRLLKTLWPKLTLTQQDALNALANDANTKQMSPRTYYEALLRLAGAYGLLTAPGADYHALRQYLAYLSLSAQVHLGKLTQELDVLQDAVEQRHFTTDGQRTLARLLEDVRLLDGLAHAKLSPDDFRKYQERHADFTSDSFHHSLELVIGHSSPVTRQAFEPLFAALATWERFYELAHQRDEAFVRNTLRLLDQPETRNPQRATILITGGFHTAGLTQHFKDRHIAYAVITPSSTGPLDNRLYQARLQNTIPPVEELLQKLNQMSAQALVPGLATDPDLPLDSTEPGVLPPAVGRTEDQDDGRISKHSALFRTYLKLRLMMTQSVEWLRDWIRDHPDRAALYGVALAVAGKAVVVSLMGQDFEFNPADGDASIGTIQAIRMMGTVASMSVGALTIAVAGGPWGWGVGGGLIAFGVALLLPWDQIAVWLHDRTQALLALSRPAPPAWLVDVRQFLLQPVPPQLARSVLSMTLLVAFQSLLPLLLAQFVGLDLPWAGQVGSVLAVAPLGPPRRGGFDQLELQRLLDQLQSEDLQAADTAWETLHRRWSKLGRDARLDALFRAMRSPHGSVRERGVSALSIEKGITTADLQQLLTPELLVALLADEAAGHSAWFCFEMHQTRMPLPLRQAGWVAVLAPDSLFAEDAWPILTEMLHRWPMELQELVTVERLEAAVTDPRDRVANAALAFLRRHWKRLTPAHQEVLTVLLTSEFPVHRQQGWYFLTRPEWQPSAGSLRRIVTREVVQSALLGPDPSLNTSARKLLHLRGRQLAGKGMEQAVAAFEQAEPALVGSVNPTNPGEKQGELHDAEQAIQPYLDSANLWIQPYAQHLHNRIRAVLPSVEEAAQKQARAEEIRQRYEAWWQQLAGDIQATFFRYAEALDVRSLRLAGTVGEDPGIMSVTVFPSERSGPELRQTLGLQQLMHEILTFHGYVVLDEETAIDQAELVLQAMPFLKAHEAGHVLVGKQRSGSRQRYRIDAPPVSEAFMRQFEDAKLVEFAAEEVIFDAIGYQLGVAVPALGEPAPVDHLARSKQAAVRLFLAYAETDRGKEILREVLGLFLARFEAGLLELVQRPETEISSAVRQELTDLATEIHKRADEGLTEADRALYQEIVTYYRQVYRDTTATFTPRGGPEGPQGASDQDAHFERLRLKETRPFTWVDMDGVVRRERSPQEIAAAAPWLGFRTFPLDLGDGERLTLQVDPRHPGKSRSPGQWVELLLRALEQEYGSADAARSALQTLAHGLHKAEKPLTVIVANTYSHLAGNCTFDGIIILHEALVRAKPDVAEALELGAYAHELGAHEIPGEGARADTPQRIPKDLVNLSALAGPHRAALQQFLSQPTLLMTPLSPLEWFEAPLLHAANTHGQVALTPGEARAVIRARDMFSQAFRPKGIPLAEALETLFRIPDIPLGIGFTRRVNRVQEALKQAAVSLELESRAGRQVVLLGEGTWSRGELSEVLDDLAELTVRFLPARPSAVGVTVRKLSQDEVASFLDALEQEARDAGDRDATVRIEDDQQRLMYDLPFDEARRALADGLIQGRKEGTAVIVSWTDKGRRHVRVLEAGGWPKRTETLVVTADSLSEHTPLWIQAGTSWYKVWLDPNVRQSDEGPLQLWRHDEHRRPFPLTDPPDPRNIRYPFGFDERFLLGRTKAHYENPDDASLASPHSQLLVRRLPNERFEVTITHLGARSTTTRVVWTEVPPRAQPEGSRKGQLLEGLRDFVRAAQQQENPEVAMTTQQFYALLTTTRQHASLHIARNELRGLSQLGLLERRRVGRTYEYSLPGWLQQAVSRSPPETLDALLNPSSPLHLPALDALMLWRLPTSPRDPTYLNADVAVRALRAVLDPTPTADADIAQEQASIQSFIETLQHGLANGQVRYPARVREAVEELEQRRQAVQSRQALDAAAAPPCAWCGWDAAMTPEEEPRVLVALRSEAEQAARQGLTPAAAAEQFAEQARLVTLGDAASGVSVRQQRWQTAVWWDWYLQEVEIHEPPGSMLTEIAQSLRTLIRTQGLTVRYRQQPPLGRETHPDHRADQTAGWVTTQWENPEQDAETYITRDTRRRVQLSVDRALGSHAGRVLDVLCGGSSVFSTRGREVFGVGLAGGVLASRSDLAGYAVQDLNAQPSLPAGAAGLWDAAVISFGAPYLTRPVPVYRSIAEHLRPGAPLILVVSQRRYHTGLAVHVWNDPIGYGFASRDAAITAYLRWAGFEDITIERIPDRYVFNQEHEVEVEDTLSVIIARRRPAGTAGGDPTAALPTDGEEWSEGTLTRRAEDFLRVARTDVEDALGFSSPVTAPLLTSYLPLEALMRLLAGLRGEAQEEFRQALETVWEAMQQGEQSFVDFEDRARGMDQPTDSLEPIPLALRAMTPSGVEFSKVARWVEAVRALEPGRLEQFEQALRRARQAFLALNQWDARHRFGPTVTLWHGFDPASSRAEPGRTIEAPENFFMADAPGVASDFGPMMVAFEVPTARIKSSYHVIDVMGRVAGVELSPEREYVVSAGPLTPVVLYNAESDELHIRLFEQLVQQAAREVGTTGWTVGSLKYLQTGARRYLGDLDVLLKRTGTIEERNAMGEAFFETLAVLVEQACESCTVERDNLEWRWLKVGGQVVGRIDVAFSSSPADNVGAVLMTVGTKIHNREDPQVRMKGWMAAAYYLLDDLQVWRRMRDRFLALYDTADEEAFRQEFAAELEALQRWIHTLPPDIVERITRRLERPVGLPIPAPSDTEETIKPSPVSERLAVVHRYYNPDGYARGEVDGRPLADITQSRPTGYGRFFATPLAVLDTICQRLDLEGKTVFSLGSGQATELAVSVAHGAARAVGIEGEQDLTEDARTVVRTLERDPAWKPLAGRIELFTTDFLGPNVRLGNADVVFYLTDGLGGTDLLERKLLDELKEGALVVVVHPPSSGGRQQPLFLQLERVPMDGLPEGVEIYRKPTRLHGLLVEGPAAADEVTPFVQAVQQGVPIIDPQLADRMANDPDLARGIFQRLMTEVVYVDAAERLLDHSVLGLPDAAVNEAVPGEQMIHVKTSYSTIREIHRVLNLQSSDTVYDLGAGDGRFVVGTAVLTPSQRVIGVELLAENVARADAAIARLGLFHAQMRRANLRDLAPADLEDGTVFFLFNPVTEEVAAQLARLLDAVGRRKSIRIVSLGARGAKPNNVLEAQPHLRYVSSSRSYAGAFVLFESVPEQPADHLVPDASSAAGSPAGTREMSAAARTPEEIVAGVNATYESIAPEYAARWAVEDPLEFAEQRASFLGRVRASGLQGPIVDAGTGPGRDAAWFSAQGMDAVGIDNSPAMLHEARQRFGDQPRLRFEQSDLRQLPFTQGSVAGIWCRASLHHLPPPLAEQALEEFARVLPPRGLLYLAVRRGTGEVWDTGTRYPTPRYFKPYESDELQALVTKYRFRVVTVTVQRASDSPTSPEYVHLVAERTAGATPAAALAQPSGKSGVPAAPSGHQEPQRIVVRGYRHFPSDLAEQVISQIYDEYDEGSVQYQQNIERIMANFQAEIASVEREVAAIQGLIANGRYVAIGQEAFRIESAGDRRDDLALLQRLMEAHGIEDAPTQARTLFMVSHGPGAYLLATGAPVELFPLERAELRDEALALQRQLQATAIALQAFVKNRTLGFELSMLENVLIQAMRNRQPLTEAELNRALELFDQEEQATVRVRIEAVNQFIRNTDERDRAAAAALKRRAQEHPDELVIASMGYAHARQLGTELRVAGMIADVYEEGILIESPEVQDAEGRIGSAVPSSPAPPGQATGPSAPDTRSEMVLWNEVKKTAGPGVSLRASLNFCLAVAAHHAATGERVLAHFLQAGHARVSREQGLALPDAKAQYLQELLSPVQGSGWQVSIISAVEPAAGADRDRVIAAEDLQGYLIHRNRIERDTIKIIPADAQANVVLDSQGRVTVTPIPDDDRVATAGSGSEGTGFNLPGELTSTQPRASPSAGEPEVSDVSSGLGTGAGSLEGVWEGFWAHPRASWREYTGKVREYWEDVFRSAAEGHPRGAGLKVLDVATGGNFAVAKIAHAVLPNAEIHAIDSSRLPKAARPAGIMFHRESIAQRTPFPDATFDLVMSMHGIEYARLEEALPELTRIMRPGARAVLVTHHPGSVLTANSRDALEQMAILTQLGIVQRTRAALEGTDTPGEFIDKVTPLQAELHQTVIERELHGTGTAYLQRVEQLLADLVREQEEWGKPVALQTLEEETAYLDRIATLSQVQLDAAAKLPSEAAIRQLMEQHGFVVDAVEPFYEDRGWLTGWAISAHRPAAAPPGRATGDRGLGATETERAEAVVDSMREGGNDL